MPILFVNFVSALSFSIVLPFLIILVVDFGGNAIIYGLLGASFSVFQLIGSPILGRWSDRVGRRKILALSHAGTLLAWVGMLVSVSIEIKEITTVSSSLFGMIIVTLPLILLFLSRVVDGLTGGNISVANAYLIDISSPEDQAKNFGYLGLASNMGFIFGPTISALTASSSLGLRLPLLIALGIGIVGMIIILTQINDSVSSITDKTPEEKKNYSFREILNQPHIGMLLSINFLIFLGFNFFYVSFPPFLLLVQEWTLSQLGALFSFFGITMAITQGPLLSRIATRVPQPILIRSGTVSMFLGFILLSYGGTILVFVSIFFIAFGNGISYPSLLAIIASHGSSETRGEIQGLTASTGSLASVIGLVIGGIMFNAIGALIFIISAIFVFLVFLLSFRLAEAEVEHDPQHTHSDLHHQFLGSHRLYHVFHPKTEIDNR